MTSMPASRAATAICSAPLEWPSSPGLPTSSRSGPPSDSAAACTLLAHRRAGRRRAPPTRADAGRAAVLAEHLAQHVRPTRRPCRRPGRARSSRGTRFSSVAAAVRSRSSARVDRALRRVRRATPSRCSTCSRSAAGSTTRMCAPTVERLQRGRLGLGEAVDAHDLDARPPRSGAPARRCSGRAGPSSRRSSRTRRRRRAPTPARRRPRRPARSSSPRRPWSPSNRSSYSSRSVSYASTCCMRSDHCWSHGGGRPSASFQHGSWIARARASFDSVTPSISSTIRCTLFSGCASVSPSEFTCTP